MKRCQSIHGGLGNVAGDQLKAASGLGLPVVGVGLAVSARLFSLQVIDHAGSQQAVFPFNDPGQLPITPVRKPDGEWLRLEIALPGYSIWLRAWQGAIGGDAGFYLLDSNPMPPIIPPIGEITSQLYGGDSVSCVSGKNWFWGSAEWRPFSKH